LHNKYKTDYKVEKNCSNKLVYSPYFKSNVIILEGEILMDYSELGSFVIYICVEGSFEIVFNDKVYKVKMGETLLLPAIIDSVKLSGHSTKILEVHL